MTVLAIGGWKNNAEMIRDGVVPLGYLRPEWSTLDLTFGLGRFWSLWRPTDLVGCDIDPAKSPVGFPVDFTRAPFADGSFDVVVFDPPYKLNGTPTGNDEDYGVHVRRTRAEKFQMILDGVSEGARLFREFLLVKCQDQVEGGKVRWQTDVITRHAEALGLRKVDALLLQSYRPQPDGRSQQHARRNYSTLLVFGRS